ncbi:hypothetical protein EHS25_000943 [Saitozyma podzolica]|uniref:Uncharacterized protein n=1 Tax=Saitozyma podzolica TaxID=1890683 RepID=A0A427YXN9_9TREE|nr:hypothetical protein EHS25_000943 [Saitozyma podzolica]
MVVDLADDRNMSILPSPASPVRANCFGTAVLGVLVAEILEDRLSTYTPFPADTRVGDAAGGFVRRRTNSHCGGRAQGSAGMWEENELENVWSFMTASPVSWRLEASKLLTAAGPSQTKEDSIELSASIAAHIATAWEAHNGHVGRRGIDSQS